MAKKPNAPTRAGLTRAQSRAYDAAIKQEADSAGVREGDPDALLRAARKDAAIAVAKIVEQAPPGRRKAIGFAKKGNRTR